MPTEINKNSKTNMSKTFRRLVQFGRPEIGQLSLAFSALAINSATNLSFPWIMGQAVDIVNSDPVQYKLFVLGTAGIFCIGSVASWVRIFFLGISTDRIRARYIVHILFTYITLI